MPIRCGATSDVTSAMQYSHEDVELWDLDQLLQRGYPLAALTADFNSFKQRFVRMFGDKSSQPENSYGSGPPVNKPKVADIKKIGVISP